MTQTIYANHGFTLTRDAFMEGDREAKAVDHTLMTADGQKIVTTVAARFPHVSSDCGMLEAMYGVALTDHERLTIEPKTYFFMLCNRFIRARRIPEGFMPKGSVFWAGYGFNTYLYTRDTAYASWLGTAYILPEVVQSHLRYVLELRRTVGLKVSKLHEIPIAGIPTEETGLSESEIAVKYNTNCYTRRTDDIVWILGMWEAYKTTQDAALISYILEEFNYFDEHFYRYFLDDTTGLYRGQSTFIDIGGAPYGGRNFSETVILKSLSTNCLYAGCFAILQKAATLAGAHDLANTFQKRRDALALAIRTHFGPVNYHHYIDDDGKSSGRQEVLGLAFLTLFDILPAAEGAKLLADYADGDYGRPLMWPFCGSDVIYHDNSSWPFANTIFALAEYKVGNRQAVIRKTMGELCRHSLNGNFNEVLEWKTGAFVGCPGYIWSAASYLALVYKMIAGLEVHETGKVSFAPILPPAMGERFELTGLKIGAMTINLCIHGNGETIEKCLINGKPMDSSLSRRAELEISPGVHELEIHLR